MKYSERKLLDYVFENMGDDGHCFHGFFWELGRDWRFDDESRTTVKYSCQVPKIELLKHSEHGHMLSTVIDFPFFTLHIAAYEKCDDAYMIRYGIQEVFVRRSKANRYSCLYIKFRHEDLIGLLRVNLTKEIPLEILEGDIIKDSNYLRYIKGYDIKKRTRNDESQEKQSFLDWICHNSSTALTVIVLAILTMIICLAMAYHS